jgi:hypothetical protein
MKLFQKAEGTAGLLRSAGFCLPRNDMKNNCQKAIRQVGENADIWLNPPVHPDRRIVFYT